MYKLIFDRILLFFQPIRLAPAPLILRPKGKLAIKKLSNEAFEHPMLYLASVDGK